MGKNRDKGSLIRLLVNTIVHEIVFKYTNRPESKNLLSSEITEYRGQTEKMAKQHTWDMSDKEDIRKKALKKIKERIESKYSDVSFNPKEAEVLLDKELNELGL